MDNFSRKKIRNRLLTLVGVVILIGSVTFFLSIKSSVVLLIAVAIGLAFYYISLNQRELYKVIDKINNESEKRYKQIEASFSVFSIIDPVAPLPEMRGWAASPDFVKEILNQVIENKPDVVLEASSGVSTLAIAYCLKKNGRGRLFSLEHDEKYLKSTQSLIDSHNLSNIVTLVHAPLVDVEFFSEKKPWYDLSKLNLEDLGEIDFLVIDGPPNTLDSEARLPALPLLISKLSKRSVILLDDGSRDGEKNIVRKWVAMFPGFSATYLCLEKGAFLLKKLSVGAR